MKKAISAVTFFNLVFILVLSLSGSIKGWCGDVLYYLAYLIPVCFSFLYIKKWEKDEIKPQPPGLLPDGKSVVYALPFVFPFILIVALISLLSSIILGALGYTDSVDVSGNIITVIFRHAVLPAFFEEAVFRFIPIALIAPYSKKSALFISSIFFAVAHCNLFQIPYALFAGLVLAYITLASGNIIPAIILHLLNNISSIILMRNMSEGFNFVFFLVLFALCAVSLVFIIIKREKYGKLLKEILADKRAVELTMAGLLFTFAMLFIGVLNLWTKF